MNSTLRQRCASALMHPVTLAALGVLLVNDLLFKALWPGAWIPGKLSDLAWMVFAPPLLAFMLSFAAGRHAARQRTAFLAAYAGLPLLYAAFNTFTPVHDVILRVLGFIGGDGPRSPLDPTDSFVIPIAMAAALWVWGRPPLETESIRARLALLVAVAAALVSVASSYPPANWGIGDVGRNESGNLAAVTRPNYRLPPEPFRGYESMDGGLTWTVSDTVDPLETQRWQRSEVKDPSGAVYELSDPHVIQSYEGTSDRAVVYSYEYLQHDGNQWALALDNRDIRDRAISTRPENLFYDDRSGNLIVAMGLQGVVVVAPDGTSTRVAVGPYSPTDFSFGGKLRTYLGLLFDQEMLVFVGFAFLLTFSFAAFALTVPASSAGPGACLVLGSATAVLLALLAGVYPWVPAPAGGSLSVEDYPLCYYGAGLFSLLLILGGMAFARMSRRRVLTVVAASVAMLPLIAAGALVLFEAGPFVANFVAVMLVGSAAFVLSVYQKRTRSE